MGVGRGRKQQERVACSFNHENNGHVMPGKGQFRSVINCWGLIVTPVNKQRSSCKVLQKIFPPPFQTFLTSGLLHRRRDLKAAEEFRHGCSLAPFPGWSRPQEGK